MARRLAVPDALSLDAEDRARYRAGRKRQLGPGIARQHAAKIIAEADAKRFVVRTLQFPFGFLHELGG